MTHYQFSYYALEMTADTFTDRFALLFDSEEDALAQYVKCYRVAGICPIAHWA